MLWYLVGTVVTLVAFQEAMNGREERYLLRGLNPEQGDMAMAMIACALLWPFLLAYIIYEVIRDR